MIKLAVLLCLVSLSPSQALNCNECINEMHGLSYMIKMGAQDIMAFLTDNYCSTFEVGQAEMCENYLVRNYVGMLYMIVEHFFVDGAQHICQEGLSFQPGDSVTLSKTPSPEYTLYLEQNYCVGYPAGCVEAVKTHFAPMHAMTVEQFWKPTELCANQEVCGATKPPQ